MTIKTKRAKEGMVGITHAFDQDDLVTVKVRDHLREEEEEKEVKV